MNTYIGHFDQFELDCLDDLFSLSLLELMLDQMKEKAKMMLKASKLVLLNRESVKQKIGLIKNFNV